MKGISLISKQFESFDKNPALIPWRAGSKCCHQSALKRLASVMNEVRHPREVMCVLETNLICSRTGHRLSLQHVMSPTGLLYAVTSKKIRAFSHHSLAVHQLDNCANTFSTQSGEGAWNACKVARGVRENVLPGLWELKGTQTRAHPNVSHGWRKSFWSPAGKCDLPKTSIFILVNNIFFYHNQFHSSS